MEGQEICALGTNVEGSKSGLFSRSCSNRMDTMCLFYESNRDFLSDMVNKVNVCMGGLGIRVSKGACS